MSSNAIKKTFSPKISFVFSLFFQELSINPIRFQNFLKQQIPLNSQISKCFDLCKSWICFIMISKVSHKKSFLSLFAWNRSVWLVRVSRSSSSRYVSVSCRDFVLGFPELFKSWLSCKLGFRVTSLRQLICNQFWSVSSYHLLRHCLLFVPSFYTRLFDLYLVPLQFYNRNRE